MPISVTGDRARLLEAINNVVVNAVQHSTAGGRVDVALARRAGMAEITVTDSGAGIAPEDLPRIFDPFFRADPARQRDPGGAGLGLALTRAAVEGHGGQVTCTSELHRGTTVVIRLPEGREDSQPSTGACALDAGPSQPPTSATSASASRGPQLPHE